MDGTVHIVVYRACREFLDQENCAERVTLRTQDELLILEGSDQVIEDRAES